MIDYRSLLKRYMAEVYASEGYTYLPVSDVTPEEAVELKRMEAEVETQEDREYRERAAERDDDLARETVARLRRESGLT
jgi:hypothetical protein